MRNPLFQQLESYVTHNNFPSVGWDERGLIPSPESVQQEMQEAVTGFVRFLQSSIATLLPGSKPLTDAVQEYLEEWSMDDFDTEEREYVYDVACEIMLLVDVDPRDIAL